MQKNILSPKQLVNEARFTKEQFSKIIWPKPLEVIKIFGWTSFMLITFALLITFVFDPISINLIQLLSSLR